MCSAVGWCECIVLYLRNCFCWYDVSRRCETKFDRGSSLTLSPQVLLSSTCAYAVALVHFALLHHSLCVSRRCRLHACRLYCLLMV